MFRNVSKSGQTLGNISEKHRETSNVSEFDRKHFCFLGSKFCFRNNVSTGGQTWKHSRKHRESEMFPQQCFLVCPGLHSPMDSAFVQALNKERLKIKQFFIIFFIVFQRQVIQVQTRLLLKETRLEVYSLFPTLLLIFVLSSLYPRFVSELHICLE